MSRHAHIALAIGLAMVGLMVLFLHDGRRPDTVVVSLPAGPSQPRLPATEAGLTRRRSRPRSPMRTSAAPPHWS